MRKQSVQDRHLNCLLELTLRQMREEASLRPAARFAPTPDDLLRADRAFQAAMKLCFQPAAPDAAAGRREKP